MLLTEGKQAQNQSLTYLNMSGAPSHALPLRRWVSSSLSLELLKSGKDQTLCFCHSRRAGEWGAGETEPASLLTLWVQALPCLHLARGPEEM